MDAELEELYQALILDHDARPRNYRPSGSGGSMASGGSPGQEETRNDTHPELHQASCYNPLCGDSYKIYIETSKGRIATICFEGHGCAISKASLSMMTTILTGKTIDDAVQFFHLFRDSLLGKNDVDDDLPGELVALTTVRNAPTRIKCALLGWEAMKEALSSDGTRT